MGLVNQSINHFGSWSSFLGTTSTCPRFGWATHHRPGQTHLNSDAKIADEGRPYQLSSFFAQKTSLQSPKTYGICDSALRSAQFQALCPEKGAHKGRPYPIQAASRGFVAI